MHPAGRTDIPGTRRPTYSVGPAYFRTFGDSIVRGRREFDSTHRAGTRAVAIVNETFAKTYFPGRDAIGQRVQTEDEPEAEVIGLVRDHRIGTIGEAPQSVVFYPFAQRTRTLVLHARTSGSPDALVTSVQRAIDEIDATVPVTVQTLRPATSLEMSMRRLGTFLMGAMGDGLALAMVGLYGVMSTSPHREPPKSASAWLSARRALASGGKCCCARSTSSRAEWPSARSRRSD